MKLSWSARSRNRGGARLGGSTLFASLAAFLLASGTPSGLARDDHNPIGVTGAFEGMITTGCAYNVLNHNATRAIDDIVVPASIGKYPLKMTRYYNSRRTFGMAPGWSHEYAWSRFSDNDKINYPNGNVWDKSCDLYGNAPLGVSDWPTIQNGQPAFRLADGGTVVFGGNATNTLPIQIIDPFGQTTTITYNGSLLIDRVTEPGGRYLLFTYNGPQGLLSRVEAHGLGNATVTDWVNYTYALKSPGPNRPSVYCLIRVDYSDGQQAKYTYDEDNVPDDPNNGSVKAFPLVIGCDDKRYHGPMRRVAYQYQDQGPHGAILKERYWDGIAGHETSGAMVSKIDPACPSPIVNTANFETTYTETRGDDPTRTFTYTDLHLTRSPGEPEECPVRFIGPAPQQFLQSYTDFQGNTTRLGYDPVTWYITSVQDANNHTTNYLRGNPPYQGGIGEIKKITYPDQAHIDYGYQNEGTGNIGGHYLTSVTEYTPSNQRRSQTIHSRDANTHKITRTDYKDADLTVLAYETFTYCDQAEPGGQCGPANPATGYMHGQSRHTSSRMALTSITATIQGDAGS